MILLFHQLMVTLMEFNLQKMVFEFQQSWGSGYGRYCLMAINHG